MRDKDLGQTRLGRGAMRDESSARTLILAEVGSVHDGSFGNAKCLIDLAAECGADGVKLQTHMAEAETLREAPSPAHFQAESRYEYFERLSFTPGQWAELRVHCEMRGVEFLSSPFSEEAVDLLETVGIGRYKIPSGEVTNIPLLERVARTGKPVLLSSGMSSWGELDRAVEAILHYHDRLTLLQCTSQYPCPYERVGLNVMLEMRERYKLPVGLSDHTLTAYASLAAVALGASVIERHITFSRKMYGSDARHALEPAEFSYLVQGIRAIETMIANPVDKDDTEPLRATREVFQKSLVSLVRIPEGVTITQEMIGIKKPGHGLPPYRRAELLGRRAARDIPAHRVIVEEDIEWS